MTLLSLLHPLPLVLLLATINASTAASTTATKSISSLLLRHQQRTIVVDPKIVNHSLPLNHSAHNASSTNTTFAAAAAAAAASLHLIGKDGQQSTGMFTQEQTHFHTIANKWEDALKLV